MTAAPETSFFTPLREVVGEIYLRQEPVVSLPARELHELLRDEYPTPIPIPHLLMVPPMPPTSGIFAPAYRFESADGSRVVQLGPRIVALNAVIETIRWPGWPAYSDAVSNVFGAYSRLNGAATVLRFTLGFYNRIPVESIAAAHELFTDGLPGPRDASSEEYQFVYTRDVAGLGSMTHRYVMVRPQFGDTLLVNTVVRGPEFDPENARFDVVFEQWADWANRAHDASKEWFYASLTQAVRDAWDRASQSQGAV